MPTAAFTTLGCKVNQYETDRILDSFADAGFEVVPFDSPADVYVINTCSVTSIAESKSRYTIRKAARNNPKAKVVVTGCAAQMALNKRESLEGADVVVPNPEKLQSLEHLWRAIPEFKSDRGPRSISPLGRTRPTLKVQDGCNVCCSYCSIPHTRPVMESRPYAELLKEARQFAQHGYHEIVLTGVLIGSYGPRTGSGGPDFEEMVRGIALHSGVERIRISSIELTQVSDRLIGLIKDGLVVPHLHIPLQSGDSDVLRDMNRPYLQEDYLRLCKKLYKEIADISITTDIMVGFPTETDERFQSSVKVCEEVGFLKAHVFRFSPRFGTPADAFSDPISIEEKNRRASVLAEVSARTGAAHCAKFVGRTMRVLAEGKLSKDGLLEGLTDNYLTVQFSGPVSLQRQVCYVKLMRAEPTRLTGKLQPFP